MGSLYLFQCGLSMWRRFAEARSLSLWSEDALSRRINTDLSRRRDFPKPSPGSEAAGSGEGGAAQSAVTDEVVLLEGSAYTTVTAGGGTVLIRPGLAAGPPSAGLPAPSTGVCRPVLAENSPPESFPGARTTENSPLDCFPGARCHCGGEAYIAHGNRFFSFPTAVGKYPRSGG